MGNKCCKCCACCRCVGRPPKGKEGDDWYEIKPREEGDEPKDGVLDSAEEKIPLTDADGHKIPDGDADGPIGEPPDGDAKKPTEGDAGFPSNGKIPKQTTGSQTDLTLPTSDDADTEEDRPLLQAAGDRRPKRPKQSDETQTDFDDLDPNLSPSPLKDFKFVDDYSPKDESGLPGSRPDEPRPQSSDFYRVREGPAKYRPASYLIAVGAKDEDAVGPKEGQQPDQGDAVDGRVPSDDAGNGQTSPTRMGGAVPSVQSDDSGVQLDDAGNLHPPGSTLRTITRETYEYRVSGVKRAAWFKGEAAPENGQGEAGKPPIDESGEGVGDTSGDESRPSLQKQTDGTQTDFDAVEPVSLSDESLLKSHDKVPSDPDKVHQYQGLAQKLTRAYLESEGRQQNDDTQGLSTSDESWYTPETEFYPSSGGEQGLPFYDASYTSPAKQSATPKRSPSSGEASLLEDDVSGGGKSLPEKGRSGMGKRKGQQADQVPSDGTSEPTGRHIPRDKLPAQKSSGGSQTDLNELELSRVAWGMQVDDDNRRDAKSDDDKETTATSGRGRPGVNENEQNKGQGRPNTNEDEQKKGQSRPGVNEDEQKKGQSRPGANEDEQKKGKADQYGKVKIDTSMKREYPDQDDIGGTEEPRPGEQITDEIYHPDVHEKGAPGKDDVEDGSRPTATKTGRGQRGDLDEYGKPLAGSGVRLVKQTTTVTVERKVQPSMLTQSSAQTDFDDKALEGYLGLRHGALKIAGPEEDGTGQGGEGERSGLPATRTKAGERLNIRDQSTPGEGRSGLDDIEGRSVLKHQLQGNDDLHDQAGTDQRKQQLDHRLYAEGRPGLQGSGQVRPSADEHLLPTSDKAAQYLGPVSEEGGLDTDRSDNMGGQLSKRLQRGMQGVDQYGEPTMDEGASEQGKLKQYGQSPSGDERPNRYGLIDKDISGVRVDQYGRPVADDVEDDDQRKYAQGEPSMYDKKGSRKLEDALRSPLGKDKSWKEQLEQPRGPLTSEQDVRQASGVITGRGLKQLAFDLHGRPIDELHPDYGRLPSDKNSKACQAGVSVTRLLRDHDYKVYRRPMGTDFLIDDGKIEGIAATVKQGASLMEADKSDATGAQGKSAESITSKEPSKEPSGADEVHPSKRPSILDELDSMMAKANAALSSAEKRLSELQTDEQEPSPDDSTEQQHPRDDECEFYKGKTPGDQDLSRPPNETTGAAGKGVPPRSTTKEKRFSGQQVEPLSEFAEGKEGRRQGETDSKGGARDIANADLASPIAGDIATDREPYTPSSPADVASSGAGESETDDSMIGTPPDAVGKDHDYRKGGDNARTPTSPLSSTNAGGKQIGTHGAMGAGPPYRSKHEYVGAISPKEESPNDKRTPSPGVVQVLDASLAASGDRTTERSDREVIRGDQAGEDEPLLEKKSSPKETSPADQVDAATTGASPLAGSPVDDAAQKAAEALTFKAAGGEAAKAVTDNEIENAARNAAKHRAEEEAAILAAKNTAEEEAADQIAKKTAEEDAVSKAPDEASKRITEKEPTKVTTKESDKEVARKAVEGGPQKTAEEDAAKKATEKATKRKAEDEAIRLAAKTAAEEGTAGQDAEETAKRKSEEDAAKKKAEVEAARRRAGDEAATAVAKKRGDEAVRRDSEEAAKKKAEEDAARKTTEEAEKQRKADQHAASAAARKTEEDKSRQTAEEATKRTEEDAARKAAEDAANRKEEEEASMAAAKKAEEEAARKAAEDAAKKKAEEDAARKAAEEAAKRKAEEEASMVAAQKKAEEEAARKAAEEAARKKAEEDAARKAAEEAAKRKAEEEAYMVAAQKKAEEEAARKAAEEAAKKKAEEDAARKAAEEAAKRKAEEEASMVAAQKKAEDEAARKAAEEAAKKKAKEDAAKRAAEEAAKRKAEEDAAMTAAKKAEEEAARKAAEEAAKKKAEEDAARKAAEEAAKRKAEEETATATARKKEEEASRKAAGDAAKKKAEEDAAKQAAEEAAKRKANEETAKVAAKKAEKEAVREEAAKRKAEEDDGRKTAKKLDKDAESESKTRTEDEISRKSAEEDTQGRAPGAKVAAEEATKITPEEAARKGAADEVAVKARAEEQAAAEKMAAEEEKAARLAAVEAAKKEAEESAKKKAAEELAAKISAEDAAQKPVEAEPAKLTGKAAKKAAKEAAKKKEAEEKAAKKAAEEARKKKDAEEKAAKKAAEEEAKKKAAEEKAAKKAAEAAAKKAAQEASKKKSDKERAAKKAEDDAARKAAEESTRKAAEDLAAKRAAEEQAKAEEEAKKAAEEAAKKAEEEAARKAAEEAAKKKADEEAAQKAAEEAAKKKAEEQKEAEKRAAEDAARKKAEEEAARKAEQEAAEEAAKKAANAVKEQETEPSAKKALEELVAKKTAEEEKAADANGVPDEVASQNPLQAEEKELKSFYREAGNNVQPIPWMEDFKVDLDDVNMDLSIENQPRISALRTPRQQKRVSGTEGRPRTPDAGKTIHIDEIFDPLTNIRGKKGEPPKRILIRGQPGIGKSTLCRKLAYDWSNPENETGTIKKFKYTFLIEGRHLGGDLKNAMAEQLLSQGFNDTPENLWKFVEDNQNDVLFIVDGYDEIDSSVKSDVGDLISKKILPQSTLVLTSRPESTKEISRSVDKQLKVEGFNQEKSADFVNKHFHVTSPNTEHAPDVTENLVAALRRDKNLQQLAAYPLCNAYLCALWEDTDGDVPTTKSSLYDRLKIVVTRRYCLKQGVPLPAKSSDVPVQFRSHYRALGELAYNGVTNNKVLFDKPLVLHKVRDPRVLQMGLLLEEHSIARTKRHEYYRFPHKAFQEFFAAQHLSEMSAYVRSPTYPKLVKDRVWRDIVLFLPGALKQQPRDLIPLFKALSEYNTTRKSTYSDVGQYRLSLDTLFEAELQDQYSTIVAPSLPSLLTESHPIIEGVSSPTLQGLACVLKQNNIDVKEFRFGVWTEKYDQNCDTLTEALNDNQTVGKLVIAACNENDVVESVKDILARLAERNNTVKSLQIIDYSYKGPLKYDERIEMLRKVCTIEEIKIDSAARVWYPGLPQNPSEAQHTIRSTPMTPMSTD